MCVYVCIYMCVYSFWQCKLVVSVTKKEMNQTKRLECLLVSAAILFLYFSNYFLLSLFYAIDWVRVHAFVFGEQIRLCVLERVWWTEFHFCKSQSIVLINVSIYLSLSPCLSLLTFSLAFLPLWVSCSFHTGTTNRLLQRLQFPFWIPDFSSNTLNGIARQE